MMLSDYVLSDDLNFEIKTVCFATTATCSLNLCKEYENDIITYINERDVVPRVSYGSVKDLRVLLMLASELLSDSLLSTKDRLDKLALKYDELLETDEHLKLYPPGTIYYMYKTSRLGIKDQEPHYVVEKSEQSHFNVCRFGENMIMHHFLDKYDNGLRKVISCSFPSAKKWHRETNFKRNSGTCMAKFESVVRMSEKHVHPS
jgi:hypothetical protein